MDTVQIHKKFFLKSKILLKKSICVIGLAVIITLVSRPILSLECPLEYLFNSEINSSLASRNIEGNLYDALKEDPDFKSLLYQIEKDNKLVRELKSSNYTLLAPDNDAFNDLGSDIFDKFKDAKLRDRILRYHMIQGRATSEQLRERIIPTLGESSITLSRDNGDVILNDAAKASCRPFHANEGLIIKINKVLIPPNLLQE